MQLRIQDFPESGAPTPKVGVLTYYFAVVRKKCKNKRIFDPKVEGRVPITPLDPPEVCIIISNV